jgi:hypothetical protein
MKSYKKSLIYEYVTGKKRVKEKKIFCPSSRAGSLAEKKFKLPARLEVSQKIFEASSRAGSLAEKKLKLPARLEVWADTLL